MYKKLVTKTMTTSAILSCSLCKSRKWEIKMKAINILLREKKRLHIKRYTKSPIWFSWNPIDKAGWTSSFSSEDAFPSVNLSPKKCNFLPMRVIVKRMKIMLMPQDECWLVMFSGAKQIKLIMIQIAWPYDRQC